MFRNTCSFTWLSVVNDNNLRFRLWASSFTGCAGPRSGVSFSHQCEFKYAIKCAITCFSLCFLPEHDHLSPAGLVSVAKLCPIGSRAHPKSKDTDYTASLARHRVTPARPRNASHSKESNASLKNGSACTALSPRGSNLPTKRRCCAHVPTAKARLLSDGGPPTNSSPTHPRTCPLCAKMKPRREAWGIHTPYTEKRSSARRRALVDAET